MPGPYESVAAWEAALTRLFEPLPAGVATSADAEDRYIRDTLTQLYVPETIRFTLDGTTMDFAALCVQSHHLRGPAAAHRGPQPRVQIRLREFARDPQDPTCLRGVQRWSVYPPRSDGEGDGDNAKQHPKELDVQFQVTLDKPDGRAVVVEASSVPVETDSDGSE
ncbi:hypothetical protein SPI_04736 [Niveomyces insectorum RCEF 264]|uniref:Uncharacterized protein n=1 Tax=Niveomyces insectorum RCEF 264 TaxID=1081102 RepID=A0A167USZ3_9HYPO|nr:hypothetical protein SPI_04736 [Niveomyces insectorum RCEF 264]